MDPAETDRLWQALSSQGDQHEKAIHEIMDSLQSLAAGVSQLCDCLDRLVTHISSLDSDVNPQSPLAPSLVPPVTPPSHSREPYIPTPARYSGELGTWRQFLHQCTLVFDQQPQTYVTDKSNSLHYEFV